MKEVEEAKARVSRMEKEASEVVQHAETLEVEAKAHEDVATEAEATAEQARKKATKALADSKQAKEKADKIKNALVYATSQVNEKVKAYEALLPSMRNMIESSAVARYVLNPHLYDYIIH